MSEASLERAYRRMLAWYPRGFQAEQGDEMLGVLMASAREGQRRPTRSGPPDPGHLSYPSTPGGIRAPSVAQTHPDTGGPGGHADHDRRRAGQRRPAGGQRGGGHHRGDVRADSGGHAGRPGGLPAHRAGRRGRGPRAVRAGRRGQPTGNDERGRAEIRGADRGHALPGPRAGPRAVRPGPAGLGGVRRPAAGPGHVHRARGGPAGADRHSLGPRPDAGVPDRSGRPHVRHRLGAAGRS
jgi:hypothetical protein